MDTPKFVAVEFDGAGEPIESSIAKGESYGEAERHGLENYAVYDKEIKPMWDVYKRIGRATPNKAFAVSVHSYAEDLLEQRIVTGCVGWAAALEKAFPKYYEVLEEADEEMDKIEDAQAYAIDQDWHFAVTEIDELAL